VSTTIKDSVITNSYARSAGKVIFSIAIGRIVISNTQIECDTAMTTSDKLTVLENSEADGASAIYV
jgi:hypothetical protein